MFSAQHQGAAIVAVTVCTNHGDTHPSLAPIKDGVIKFKELRLRFELGGDLAGCTVRTVGAQPQPGKSYELWAVGGGRDKPQSLGVIDASFRIPASKLGKIDPAVLNDTLFAVSLEPEGGSPTGQATGPVLFTGKLVATE